ncbi:purine-nucleoside phosphorylase [Paenibacillus harenae]|uniref:Purine nucleoside phosphorylase n=1 Tax=Paenibacillus harenae TaxID=306543 RepID=A0ABT9U4Y0_PAEHA|nr:purine-nucleoside phosphorylase [Paenibacillus harenae]MDQ0062301.1 purine-nucleoside phosphorylase [Paenibacillus harenae]MDQ0114692.1 purine-nucleoside phosphorylase [Paenibacillus harenae]
MDNMLVKIKEAAAYIQSQLQAPPRIGMILGSGLGVMADEVKEATVIPYGQIPHFPVSTVEGHSGELVIGELEGKTVLVMKGRFHYYEGYSMKEVVFPVYVMKQLGIETLLVTNAAGGMNRSFAAGDLMLITDHINNTGSNPLMGANIGELGPRFPDMSQAYNRELRSIVAAQAAELDIPLQQGVYVSISGPTYCTPAELAMMASWGADAVGMSTAPEVIAANYCGIRAVGITCITDMAISDELEPLTHEQVVRVAEQARPRFVSLVKASVRAFQV